MAAFPAEDPSCPEPAPRWRRLPEERPSQIIEAAFRVFGEQGLQRARLEDVAHEAGVSKGTIYLYFDSKETLFREVVRTKIVSAIEQGELAFATTGASADELRELARFHWEYVTSPVFQKMYRLVHSDLAHFPDLSAFYGREVIERWYRLLASVLERGMERGELRRTDPVVLARIFSSMFITHGLWYSRREQFQTFPNESADEVRDSLLEFFLKAAAASPAPASRSTT